MVSYSGKLGAESGGSALPQPGPPARPRAALPSPGWAGLCGGAGSGSFVGGRAGGGGARSAEGVRLPGRAAALPSTPALRGAGRAGAPAAASMSSSRAKKVKMATKSCPECDQQVRGQGTGGRRAEAAAGPAPLAPLPLPTLPAPLCRAPGPDGPAGPRRRQELRLGGALGPAGGAVRSGFGPSWPPGAGSEPSAAVGAGAAEAAPSALRSGRGTSGRHRGTGQRPPGSAASVCGGMDAQPRAHLPRGRGRVPRCWSRVPPGPGRGRARPAPPPVGAAPCLGCGSCFDSSCRLSRWV